MIDVGVPDRDGNLGHFVVGRVLAADPHPNADRLQLCQVDVGNRDPASRSSAAPGTSASGATVAVGLPGAQPPRLSPARSRSGRFAAKNSGG